MKTQKLRKLEKKRYSLILPKDLDKSWLEDKAICQIHNDAFIVFRRVGTLKRKYAIFLKELQEDK